MHTLPTTWEEDYAIIMPPNPNKDERSRLGYYLDWLALVNRPWFRPDLRTYRDYLLYEKPNRMGAIGLSPATVQAHLSTIRGRYEALLRDNSVRELLYSYTAPDAAPADRKAFVDELLLRLQNETHPANAPVKVIRRQDEADAEYLRLKPHQVTALLRSPGIETLPGLRDTAIFALMVCTGIREGELCDLHVSDLRQALGGELALLVREGKGSKQRLVPYGPLDWCLVYVQYWLDATGIVDGPVFRGFYKGNKRIRETPLTTRAVNLIFNQYPVIIDGLARSVTPHDLRRTYARNAYDNGMDLERIRQNLGHANLQTTQRYIGTLNADQRRPPAMFPPPY